MSIQSRIQRPLRLSGAAKTDPRTQFAVLPWRISKGKLKVCLVTSRETGRWILPKGWPMGGATPAQAAGNEAWEEAGLKGDIAPQPIGLYSYRKRLGSDELPVIVVVYAMRVTEAAADYPERGQRKRKWMGLKKASERLSDEELAHIVRHFDPKLAKV
ncbi:NUDIX hydrolase [Histidinibacterium aquaticum]|uniref:NUDIX hydrolase n=1 Tax=Histidinibacterium aquaticum TaxID=2613962 RepID=A0A5J5GR10_9RHOB|nr:NUDIX hydrolase [Histidinibacterium aquaticum]KAA9010193.1 NUDIX hydrolase [Histidinibacterium aquaticum]